MSDGAQQAAPPLPASAETVVLGAGIAGLSYAHGRGPGADVLLLEATPRAGGLVRTEHAQLPAEHGGGALHFEWGPEALQDNAPEMLAQLAELGLAALPSAEAARQRFVLREGRLVPLPMSPSAFLTSPLLGVGGKLRALSEPLRDARTALEGSVADFVRHRLGSQVLERLVDPFVTGIYAGDPELLSLRAAFPLLHQMVSEHGSLLSGLRARGKAARARGEARKLPSLVSLQGGLAALPEALAAALGQRLRTGVRVSALRREAAGDWRVQTASGEVRARRVVCALPVTAAAKLLAPVSAELGAALGGMSCESVVSLVHCWRREDVRHPLDGFGYLVPGVERRLHLGTLFSSSIQPGRCPPGTVLLRTLLGGARHARMVEWPDEELHATLADDVAPLLGLSGAPLFTSIVRQRAALPRYDLAQPARQERVQALLGSLPGLALVGNHRRGISVNALIEASRVLAREHRAAGSGLSGADTPADFVAGYSGGACPSASSRRAPSADLLAEPKMLHVPHVPLALAAALLLPACAGTYKYRYEPQPAVVQVHTAEGTLDLLLVTVLGATRPEGAEQDEMHLRFRLQNGTKQPLRLPPGRQHLLSGDLLDFGAPYLVAGEPVAAPGQATLVDIAFPFPDLGTTDVRGLTLGWVLEVDGAEMNGTTTFQRVMRDYNQYPYPYGPYGPWGPYYGPYSSPWSGYGYH